MNHYPDGHNVGLGMVPCKKGCNCADCQMERMSAALAASQQECERLRSMQFKSVSQICAEYHFQNCSNCDRLDCGDNTTYVKQRIAELKAECERLREVQRLTASGLNLEGIKRVMALEEAMA